MFSITKKFARSSILCVFNLKKRGLQKIVYFLITWAESINTNFSFGGITSLELSLHDCRQEQNLENVGIYYSIIIWSRGKLEELKRQVNFHVGFAGKVLGEIPFSAETVSNGFMQDVAR